jgi:hypothetical protein
MLEVLGEVAMKLHLVWSGQKSKAIAKNLEWLFRQQPEPVVLTCQSHGLGSARFYPRIHEPLGPMGVVLFCLTPENPADLWLSNHAGYLAAAREDCRFACLCHEVEPEEVRGPLAELPSYPLTPLGLGAALSAGYDETADPALVAWLEGAWPAFLSELDRFLGALRAAPAGGHANGEAESDAIEPLAGRDPGIEALHSILGAPAAEIILTGTSYREQKRRFELAFQLSVLESILRATQGDVKRSAEWLEIGRGSTYLLMKRSGLRPRLFRPQPPAEGEAPPAPEDSTLPAQDSPLPPPECPPPD